MVNKLFLIFILFFAACTTTPNFSNYENINSKDLPTQNITSNSNKEIMITPDKIHDVTTEKNLTRANINLSVQEVSGVSIANWNLQIFGVSKASNLKLLNFYVDVIDEFDIIFIQEIRDKSQSSFEKLCDLLNDYNCKVSSRAGRSSSKEQYGVIYKKSILITEFKDYNPDLSDRWERPPIKVTFDVDDYIFSVYNIHIKPDDVQNELYALESIVENTGNELVLGDLNADCNYYNNDKENEFNSWYWILNDNEDTTTSATDCAYDRIILNSDMNEEFNSYGIYSKNIVKEISDHYLVWVQLGLNDFKPKISEIKNPLETPEIEEIITQEEMIIE